MAEPVPPPKPWKGNDKDANIKKTNFLKENQAPSEKGKDYLSQMEIQWKEEEEKKKKKKTKKKKSKKSGPPVIKVKVIEARDLVVLKESKMPDPCVHIILNEETFTSGVQKKTIDPLWDFEIEIEINPLVYNELEIYVWDGVVSGNFLGATFIDLSKLETQLDLTSDEPRWYNLLPRFWSEKSNVGGQIQVLIERKGSKIPPMVPNRRRKNEIFDLELTTEEAENLLTVEELLVYNGIKNKIYEGQKLFDKLKKLTADLDGLIVKSSSKIKKSKKKNFAWDVVLETDYLKINELPEEVLFRIFTYLSSIERARMSKVCSLWNRIMKDEQLTTPAMEMLKCLEREKIETDTTQKKLLAETSCKYMKDVVLNLRTFHDWRNSAREILVPFPISTTSNDKNHIPRSLALVQILMKAIKLVRSVDLWKTTLLKVCPKFREGIYYFRTNWITNLVDVTAEEKEIFNNPTCFNNIQQVLDENCLVYVIQSNDISNGLIGINAANTVHMILKTATIMIKKQLYTEIDQLQTILDISGNSLLLISLSGQIPNLKRIYNFKAKEYFKIFKQHEEYFPPWIANLLFEQLNYKSDINLQYLVNSK